MVSTKKKSIVCLCLLSSLEVQGFMGRTGIQPWQSRPRSARSWARMSVQENDGSAARKVLATTILASALAVSPAYAADGSRWAVSEFFTNLDSNSVERVVFSADSKELLALDADGGRHAVEILPSQVPELVKALRNKEVPFAVQAAPSEDGNALANLAVNLLFPLALLGGLFFLGRRGGGPMGGGPGGMGGPMGMLQSRSKVELEPKTGVTFDDVAGCDQSKLELEEVVDFLSNPEKFSKVGAQSPRGVLLEGPPGTGKTLLARAVAGEAGVPFISTSGSEFVEMFVGVGASRIRSLFADAKKNAPCIIFIDEIDAIGRQRAGGGGFATNDEREQTLNQILTEMDGFSGNTGVIVIAATNRGDILDNALLRPGRFDRRVPVDLPDKQGRAEILKVHCRDKPLASDVDIDSIASRTIGFSGASLQNLMNEAAIVAARNGKDVITFDEIDYAIDRLTVGMQKQATSPGQSKESRLRRQTLVAYHEAGHAIMAALTPGYDNVAKVTIIPRSNGAGGFTLFTPSEDRMESGLYSLRYLKSQLAVALGGRVAEELAFGVEEVTTGASNDLQQVRNLARRMIAQWGFRATADANAILDAPVAWETPDAGQQMFGGPQTASGSTEQLIDAEVKALVSEAYATCKKTLKDNWALMEKLKEELIENETVDSGALQNLVLEHTQSGGTMATA
uniref:AAA+ ATPase domain-containing protein n=1 Tax=Aureoumbra lagunensis TaxID=44058 RepID=A0A7S3NKC7_9STRA|eukprot:CAMPEP_0197287588 /NCGR_PEP_ID=MMETSP0890-20130614/4137_1 /TAXON_ID=44058 ORGANISM="Aureoumbra lagunensis, Strain CCMP1510" /NCGR_SAMPLE_ID=MMETSP0890 /ASSEMBLY_ACC=CAM_ASM_000533 /LENGTH=681 /DNA_ID=CAMNT_0042757455 /DNA_START=78 /DNA_END=2123 /DNA_ORIENTATION=+